MKAAERAAVNRPAPEAFCERAHVSRETYDALVTYETLLLRWQATLNLVSPSTLADVWTRHFADSAQLPTLVPNAARWLDLGSGAGFPGLVAAIILRERSAAHATLIESDQRKCAFLRTVGRETRANVNVICARIEAVIDDLDPYDIVSARALAPLPKLVSLARPVLNKGAIGLFMIGEKAHRAMDFDAGSPTLTIQWLASRTQETSAIACVRRVESAP